MPHADVAVDRSAYTVTATMSNSGPVGVSLLVFPDKYQAASATPFTVVAGANKTYTWTATERNTYGYAFSIYGPDGFVRSFAGDIIPASTTTGQIPRVAATPVTGPAPVAAAHAGQRRIQGGDLHPDGQRLRRHDARPDRGRERVRERISGRSMPTGITT